MFVNGDVGGARALRYCDIEDVDTKRNRMQIEWNVRGDEIQLPANRTCVLAQGVFKVVSQNPIVVSGTG